MTNDPSPRARAPKSPLRRVNVDAIRLSAWRRFVLKGDGPELTLAEAAAVMGLSVRSVQRMIAAGRLQSLRDRYGRVRVVPSLGPSKQAAADHTQEIEKLWDEFKSIRARLEGAVDERRDLIGELASTRAALEHAQNEIANLWHLLSHRSVPPPEISLGPIELSLERCVARKGVSKVRAQISDIRELAKRRRRPWALAG